MNRQLMTIALLTAELHALCCCRMRMKGTVSASCDNAFSYEMAHRAEELRGNLLKFPMRDEELKSRILPLLNFLRNPEGGLKSEELEDLTNYLRTLKRELE